MKLIAIDSSGLVATVAIATEDVQVAEYTVNHKKTHSQTLLPMLNEISRMTELDLKTVDAIAIASGPGSFTGLRIGSATAKGLGLALDIPLVEIPTTDALAMNLWGSEGIICPIMDARRDQVYTGFYEFDKEGELVVIRKSFAEYIDKVADALNGMGRKVTFLGDGVPVYRKAIEARMTVPFAFAPLHMSRQRAGALAALAVKRFKEGLTVTAADHKPDYLRASQAEQNMSSTASSN